MTSSLDKEINCRCICKTIFFDCNKPVSIFFPCEHIIHQKCYKPKYSACPYCNKHIDKCLTYDEIRDLAMIKKEKQYVQNYIDLCSVSSISYATKVNYFRMYSRSLEALIVSSSIPLIKTQKDLINFSINIFSATNLYIDVHGKIDLDKKQIIIANHTSFIDGMIIYALFKCGFIGSSKYKSHPVTKNLLGSVPVLYTDRGKNKGVVDKIPKFLDEHKRLCIFPEGMISSPNSMTRFRTGAFRANQIIQPVVLKYNVSMGDHDMADFIKKLLSHKKIIVEMHIMEQELPPFNDTKIENIRRKMAHKGGFILSRVSNRSMTD